jgi:hypothetical protein
MKYQPRVAQPGFGSLQLQPGQMHRAMGALLLLLVLHQLIPCYGVLDLCSAITFSSGAFICTPIEYPSGEQLSTSKSACQQQCIFNTS